MKKRYPAQMVRVLSFDAFVWVAGPASVHAQFGQNKVDTIHVDASSYPPDIQKGYRLFQVKCNECHGRDVSLNTGMSPERWTAEVRRMRAMASSRISDEQAKAITDFLTYDQTHRKSAAKAPESASVPEGVAAGRAFYSAQGCDACHTIGGQGGTVGPPLNDVGKRRSRDELLQRMRDRRAGAVMPPLPTDTTDQQINQLVDFLLTLKGK